MAQPPHRLRLAYLRAEYARARHHHNVILAALVAEEAWVARVERRQRRWWVRPWLLRRPLYGDYDTLMVELEREHQADFKKFLRMEPAMFRELLRRVGPRIERSREGRQPLSAGLKLAITLRYLATGDSYQTLCFNFRVAHNTISRFIPEVCEAIVEEYGGEVFHTPANPQEWRQVADQFSQRWNLPHCCGAIDGKHIAIRQPRGSGTLYHNYKGFFSIVLLALVDGDYKFLWADVGANGSSSDCGVFNRSALEPALRTGTIGFPDPEPLRHDDRDIPYFLAGDDAFPLRPYMMKPFPDKYLSREQRIFNYRLSRGRRVVENAFGILANRFRCLLSTMGQRPQTVKKITKACLCLHNLMRIRYPTLQNNDLDHEDGEHQVVPGAWRNAAVMHEVAVAGRGPRLTGPARAQRVYLMKYFNDPVGRVDWQDAAIDM